MVGEDADGDIAPIGQGKPQSYWLKSNSRNSFVRVGSSGRNTVRAGSSGQEAGNLVRASPEVCFV